jgi:hypothetical protein
MNTNERNLEIIEKYFEDVKRIIYMNTSKKTKIKMLYKANYWARYMMEILNSHN